MSNRLLEILAHMRNEETCPTKRLLFVNELVVLVREMIDEARYQRTMHYDWRAKAEDLTRVVSQLRANVLALRDDVTFWQSRAGYQPLGIKVDEIDLVKALEKRRQ